jgi:hypothetical protein
VLLEHREESDALFGLAIRVHNGFVNQRFELTGAKPLPRTRLTRRFRHDDLRGGVPTGGVGPALRRELVDQPLRVCGDAEQDVLQILEGRYVDEFAALDERVQQRGAMGPRQAPREQPVLAAVP